MLSRLVFSVTYDCPVSCKYCVTESGPWDGPALDAAFMCRAIDEALQLGGLASIVFTGGEPMLKRDEVEQTIRHAHQYGLWTRIVTNSYWAASPEVAAQTLGELKQAGLREINFSCDDLHQEHIPMERVRNAYHAARQLDLPVLVAHKQVRNGRITPETIAEFLGVELTEFKEGEANPQTDLYASSLTVPVGLGSKTLDPAEYIIYPSGQAAWAAPCSGILSSVIISPTKEVRICCGMIDQRVPELSIGSLEHQTLAEIVCNGNSDLIANWLALEGPFGIMCHVREKEPQIAFQEQYVNHCHLCNDLFTRAEVRDAINRHAPGKAETIALQRGFLEAIRFKGQDAL